MFFFLIKEINDRYFNSYGSALFTICIFFLFLGIFVFLLILSYTSNKNYVETYSNNLAIKQWLLSTTKIQSISEKKRLKRSCGNDDQLLNKFRSSFERFSFANTSLRSVRSMRPSRLKHIKKKKLKKPIIYLEEPSTGTANDDFVNIPIIKVRYYTETDDNVNSSVESTRSISMYSNDENDKSDIN